MEKQVDIVQDYTGRGMMFIEDVDPVLFQTDLETAFNTTKEADAKMVLFGCAILHIVIQMEFV